MSCTSASSRTPSLLIVLSFSWVPIFNVCCIPKLFSIRKNTFTPVLAQFCYDQLNDLIQQKLSPKTMTNSVKAQTLPMCAEKPLTKMKFCWQTLWNKYFTHCIFCFPQRMCCWIWSSWLTKLCSMNLILHDRYMHILSPKVKLQLTSNLNLIKI